MNTPAPAGEAIAPRFKTHFVESVLLTWVGNAGRIVIGLVALRLVTDAIPEADLGAYWILTSVAALLANFADLGLSLGVVRHLPLATDARQARRLMQTTAALRLAMLAFLCLLIAACRPGVLRLFGAEAIASRYFYLYVFVVVNSLSELYTNFLQGQNRFRLIALYALLSSTVRLVLIVTLVRGLNMHVQGLFLAEALSMALVALFAAWSSGYGGRFGLDRLHAVRQLRFGFPLYLNILLAYSATRLNTLFVGGMLGPAAVSYFSVASRIPDQLSLVQRSYNFVYLPNMSRLLAEPGEGQAARLLAASLRIMSFSFAFLTLLLGFFRHELLGILAPPSYQVAAPAVPLLVGGLAFAALGNILGSTLVALGDSRTPLYINLWTTLVSIVLNVVCIHQWGFLGAAWASFAFNVVAWAVTDLVLRRRIQLAGRGYLGILAFLAIVMMVGLRAGLALRVALLAAAGGGSLLLSPALRDDLLQVWNARIRPRVHERA
jgi:lipopolysaccharide exporter